jgi:hypothetical protein
MAKKAKGVYEVGGISVVIGPAISKDGGLVVVVRKIRESTWFKPLVDSLLAGMSSRPLAAFNFNRRPKLEAGLVALIAGLVMGRRNPNAIAQSFALDPLWKATIGRSFIQRDLSRLIQVISECGEMSFRQALLQSALEGQDSLELDMDSSLLELHGTQEKGSYNGHYHAFGYHAGWALDVRTCRIAALWLNEGRAHTAEGQAEQLTWLLDQGAPVTQARFDAGLIGPSMLQSIEGRVDRFVCQIRPNDNLERLADPLEPPMAQWAGARSYGEFRYAADTWTAEQRVVVRFQAPEGADDSRRALFPDRFFFVTSLKDAPADVVRCYQQRGEAERVFGEFVNTLQPTFRHIEVRKNIVWALLVALAHNVLSDLRDLLPKPEKPARIRLEHRPEFLPEAWVFGFHRLLNGMTQPVRPLLSRVRDLALRVPCLLKTVGERTFILNLPDIQAPDWFPALVRN